MWTLIEVTMTTLKVITLLTSPSNLEYSRNGLFGLPRDSSSCLLSWETATGLFLTGFTSRLAKTLDRSSSGKKKFVVHLS